MQSLKLKRIKKVMSIVFCLILLALTDQLHINVTAAVVSGSSLSPDSIVSEGNRYYMNREYDLAAQCYNKVIGMGLVSGELYYNLGNSYYKQDSLSKAILFYEKALLLKPGDEDVRQNLALANARIIDKIDDIPDFFIKRWINEFQGLFSPDRWAIISLILFIFALAAFLWFVLSNQYQAKRVGFVLGIIFLAFSFLGILSMQKRTHKILKSDSAIIMTASVNAKSSPDEQSTNMFVLHEGTKVTLLDSVQHWKEIRIADGNKGWIPETVLEEI